MFSYFLNPNRLLLSAFLLLMCSLFVVPISRVDIHLSFLTFTAFYFIAYFKVKKNGIEFYAEKIRVNKNLLITIFTYTIIIILFDLYRVKSYDENTTVIIHVLFLAPLEILSIVFFQKVFIKK